MQYLHAKTIWTLLAQPLSQRTRVEQPVGPLLRQRACAWKPRWRLTEPLRTIGVQGAYFAFGIFRTNNYGTVIEYQGNNPIWWVVRFPVIVESLV